MNNTLTILIKERFLVKKKYVCSKMVLWVMISIFMILLNFNLSADETSRCKNLIKEKTSKIQELARENIVIINKFFDNYDIFNGEYVKSQYQGQIDIYNEIINTYAGIERDLARTTVELEYRDIVDLLDEYSGYVETLRMKQKQLIDLEKEIIELEKAKREYKEKYGEEID